MEKISLLLRNIMLCLLLAVIALALGLAVYTGLESPSYPAALAMGAVAAVVALFLRKRAAATALARPVSPARTCVLLSVLCAAVNLAWVLTVRIEPFSDYAVFWQTACALATDSPLPAPGYIALFPHLLGYPSVLALFLRLFGTHVMVAALLNVLLTTLSGVVLFALCLRLRKPDAAKLALLIWCFMPTRLMLNSLCFSEPMYTLVILLILLLITRLYERQEPLSAKPPLCLLSGVALGLLLRALNILRPLSPILLIALALWLLLLRGSEEGQGRLWFTWLLIFAAALAVYWAGGQLWQRHFVATVGEEPASRPIYSIFVGFNGETEGQWCEEDMDVLLSYRESMSASDAQESMLPQLRERLESDKLELKKLFLAKLYTFLGNDELGGYTYRFTRSALFVKLCMVIGNIYYYAVILLAVLGLIRALRRPRLSVALLIPLYTLGLTLAHMLIEVNGRYHYSLIPMLIIMAAFALADTRSKGGRPNDA